MLEAFLLLIASFVAGAVLGLILLKPFLAHIQTSAQMLYVTALIGCFFPAGTAMLYLTLGAPLLVTPIGVYHDMISEE